MFCSLLTFIFCGLFLKGLWTGRQLVNLLLPPILFYEYKHKSDDTFHVRIRNGVLECGQWTSPVVDADSRSIVAHLARFYDLHHMTRFVRQFQLLGCLFLQDHVDGIGLRDLSSPRLDETIAKKNECVREFIEQGQSHPVPIQQLVKKTTAVWSQYVSENKNSGPLDQMVLSGARAKPESVQQLGFAIGVQSGLDHAIVLPHFRNDALGCLPMAQSMVTQSFYEGMCEFGFFLHARVGREGTRLNQEVTPKAGYKDRLVSSLAKVRFLEKSVQKCLRLGRCFARFC